MRYAIISDIHANESALRHILADAAAAGAEKIVCLGDVVGYGPMPKETVALVRESAEIVLAGNHDDAVSGRQNADGFIDLAGDAVRRHREALDADSLSWLRTLPYVGTIEGAALAHGDLSDPKRFYYVENEEDARANFAATDVQLAFVGHTHTPCIFLTGRSGTVYRLEPQDFVLEDGKRYIVNPGTVGYPRESNGTCFSTYVLYDSERRQVAFRKIPFSVSSVMQRGTTQQRLKKRLIAPAVLLLAIGASAAFLLGQRRTDVQTVTVEVEKPIDPALLLEEKSLTLGHDMRFVRANLKLDAEADPVDLQIVFLSATGETTGTVRKTVKGSSRDRIKIPEKAVSARITLWKAQADARPRILSFAPSAAVK